MNLPEELLTVFAGSEKRLNRKSWFGSEWMSCSGFWDDERYTDTIVLKLSKKDWSSSVPMTLYAGGEIHYAAWIDQNSFKKKELVFGMHVFGYPMIHSKKVRKKDFTDWFRSTHGESIQAWGNHTVSKGPQVPYAGTFKFETFPELEDFMVEDFDRFSQLANSIDEGLSQLKAEYETG